MRPEKDTQPKASPVIDATETEKIDVIKRSLKDTDLVNFLFDALMTANESQWNGKSDFVQRKLKALAFVRGIRIDQLEELEKAIEMIHKGHAFSKHFRVLRHCKIHGQKLKTGQLLVLEGHGWVLDPTTKEYTHPFSIMDGNQDVGSININDRQLARSLKNGGIRALD